MPNAGAVPEGQIPYIEDEFISDEYLMDTEDAMQALAIKLVGFGLGPHEVDVVLAHDVAGMSFEEICIEGGFVNSKAVERIYSFATEKAKRAYSAEEMRLQ